LKAFIKDVEVRSTLKDRIKRYYAKGYASFKGLDTYRTKLSKKAQEKIAKDLKARDIRVGVQHQDAINDKITRNLLKLRDQLVRENKSTLLVDEAIKFASKRKLPLGKPRKVEVDDNGVLVEVEINPFIRDIDPIYYDAVVNMLEDGFLDGFSIEFSNAATHDEYDESGRRYSVINDLEVEGLEFVSGAANSGARIAEVFCRMAGIDGGDSMNDELEKVEKKYKEEMEKMKKQLEEAEKKLKEADELSKQLDSEKEEKEKIKEEKEKLLKEKEEEEKSLKEELSELKEMIKEQKDSSKLSSAKGIVKQEDKYGASRSEGSEMNDLEKLREELDKKSMSELVSEAYNKGI